MCETFAHDEGKRHWVVFIIVHIFYLSIYLYVKKGIGVESPYGLSPVPETANVERAETVSPAAMLEKYAGNDVVQVGIEFVCVYVCVCVCECVCVCVCGWVGTRAPCLQHVSVRLPHVKQHISNAFATR